MESPEYGEPLRLQAAHWRQIAEQIRAGIPLEVCGLLGGVGRRVLEVFPAENVAPDPSLGYDADPQTLYDVLRLLDERGWELVGIYHSHPPGARAAPSATDVRRAAYPSAVHLIVVPSADGAALTRRGYLIPVDGNVVEVPVVVEGAEGPA